jgi:phospholipid/cholesterol/gamma-HCH transport system substrate-binding protein
MKEEVKAGIIIVSSLLILSAFVVLIGGGEFFTKYDRYYVQVTNAGGLETGAQVRLGGVRVGRVLAIREPDGPGRPVTIEVGVRKGLPLYKGTQAVITQIGFVGDIYLLLTVSETQAGGEKIAAGSDIPAAPTVEFTMMMAKLNMLAESVDGLVKDVDRLFSPANIERIEGLVANTNKAVVTGASSIEKMATSFKSVSAKLELVLNELEDLVKSNKGEVAGLIKQAREDLVKANEMIGSFQETSKSVGKASGSIDRAVQQQSRNLDLLMSTMTRTTRELQELLQEIKNKPWSIIYQERKGE